MGTLGARRALRFVTRGAPWAVAVAALCAAGAFQLARVTPPTFQSDIALLVSRPLADVAGTSVVTPPVVAPGAYRSALWEGGIVAGAFEQVLGVDLGDAARERLERTVRVAIDDQQISSVLRIEVRHGSADTAAQVADAIAGGLVDWDRARAAQALARRREAFADAAARLEDAIASTPQDDPVRPALEAELATRRADAAAAAAFADAAATVPAIEPLSAATVPDEPVAPRPVFSTAVAFALGLAGTYALLYIGAALDPRVRDPTLAREMTGVPVLAVVPRWGTGADAREAARVLRTRLVGLARDAGPPSLLVTCPRDAAAKGGVAVALADALAERGDHALLVDADVREGAATRHLLGPPDRDGDLISDQPIAIAAGRQGRYAFLPSRAPTAQPLEAPGARWSDRLDAWSEAYDAVIIDGAPIVPYADALPLAARVTGVVLCLARERTTRDDLLATLELLGEQGATVLGLVLTTRQRSRARGLARRGRAPRPAQT